MFLSHVFSVAFFVLALVMAVWSGQETRFSALALQVGFIVMICASVKLGKSRWVWIGATERQMRERLKQIEDRLSKLEEQLFPPPDSAGFTPLPNHLALRDERAKLVTQRNKLEDALREYARG